MPSVSQFLEQGLAHHRSGELAEAERLYRRIVRIDPRHADALHLLGVVALERKQHTNAVDYISRAIELNGGAAMYYTNLAAAQWELGRDDDAVASYGRALDIAPDWAEAWINLGTVHFAGGRLDDARSCYERGLRIDPSSPLAWNNLGSIHRSQLRMDASIGCFRRALTANPHYAHAHNNLGNALRDSWKLDEAAACYRRALELQPEFAHAHNNLGNVLVDMKRGADAVDCYRRAIAADPAWAEAHRNLGVMYAGQGRLADARGCYRRAMALSADDDALKIQAALLMPAIPASSAEIQNIRSGLCEEIARLSTADLSIDDPVQRGCGPLFYTAYHGLDDRPLLESLAALYLRATPSLDFVAPHCRRPAAGRDIAGRRIRVGFISRFFYQHSIGDHYADLITNIPRDNLRVTVFRFPSPEDEVTWRLAQSADSLVTLCPHLETARRQIAGEELDVLYYTDIGQDPWTYFLAFARLAPVQCVSLGQPVTTGIPNVDYFISDELIEAAGADSHYSETLVRLADHPNSIQAPVLSSRQACRADFGLDDRSHLYVCPQMLFKIHPEFDALLGQILRADPDGQIVLFEGDQPHWTVLLESRLGRSIPDVMHRVRFLPRQPFDAFLHLLSLSDVLLDTIHFSGGTTTSQAFSLGLPIVTHSSRFARGRGTSVWYRRMGVTDCIAETFEEYVQIAVDLGTNPAKREQIRTRIRAAGPVLFGNNAGAKELAKFFVEAVGRLPHGGRPCGHG